MPKQDSTETDLAAALLALVKIVNAQAGNVSALADVFRLHMLAEYGASDDDDDADDDCADDDEPAPVVADDPAWDSIVAELGAVELSDGLVLDVVRAAVAGSCAATWTRDVAATLYGREFPSAAESRRVGVVLSRLAARGDVVKVSGQGPLQWTIKSR
jgi:hypothetical protein